MNNHHEETQSRNTHVQEDDDDDTLHHGTAHTTATTTTSASSTSAGGDIAMNTAASSGELKLSDLLSLTPAALLYAAKLLQAKGLIDPNTTLDESNITTLLSSLLAESQTPEGASILISILTNAQSFSSPATNANTGETSSSNSSTSDELNTSKSNKRKFEPDSESEGVSKRKKCFRCGGVGHIQPECTSAQTSNETTNSFMCYKCGGKGTKQYKLPFCY